jgi:hypothetical protein
MAQVAGRKDHQGKEKTRAKEAQNALPDIIPLSQRLNFRIHLHRKTDPCLKRRPEDRFSIVVERQRSEEKLDTTLLLHTLSGVRHQQFDI